ncbi:hypothetical protein D9M70_509360 [compost metagenome]
MVGIEAAAGGKPAAVEVGRHRVQVRILRQPVVAVDGKPRKGRHIRRRRLPPLPGQAARDVGQQDGRIDHALGSDDKAMVAENQRRGVVLHPFGYSSGKWQPRPGIGHKDMRETGKPLGGDRGTDRLHRRRDRLDAMHMHHHPLRHQRMHRRFDRRAQARGVALGNHEVLGLLRRRIIALQRIEQRIERHWHHDVALAGMRQPEPRGLDPERPTLLDRGVAARPLHQQRIRPDTGRKIEKRFEFQTSHLGLLQAAAC